MTIYLTRHGETDWNRKDLILGRTDIPLNENGLRQAERLAEELADVRLDAIYTSPLQRALVMAETVAAKHPGCRLEVCENLIEMNFGKYEGGERFDTEYQQEKRNYFKRYEGGESYMDIAARVYPFIEQLKKNNEDVLMVTHNGICRVICNYFHGMENEEFAKFAMRNCEVRTFQVAAVEN